jgi:hypothetical protein
VVVTDERRPDARSGGRPAWKRRDEGPGGLPGGHRRVHPPVEEPAARVAHEGGWARATWLHAGRENCRADLGLPTARVDRPHERACLGAQRARSGDPDALEHGDVATVVPRLRVGLDLYVGSWCEEEITHEAPLDVGGRFAEIPEDETRTTKERRSRLRVQDETRGDGDHRSLRIGDLHPARRLQVEADEAVAAR